MPGQAHAESLERIAALKDGKVAELNTAINNFNSSIAWIKVSFEKLQARCDNLEAQLFLIKDMFDPDVVHEYERMVLHLQAGTMRLEEAKKALQKERKKHGMERRGLAVSAELSESGMAGTKTPLGESNERSTIDGGSTTARDRAAELDAYAKLNELGVSGIEDTAIVQ